MIHRSLNLKKGTVTGFNIVEIRIHNLPVGIMEMVSIDGIIWEKKACFDSLFTAMYNHIDNLSTLNLITTVSSEVHMDNATLFIEADAVKKNIMESIYTVSHLTGLKFLISSGNVAKNPSSIDDKDFTKDLAYIRLSCTIDANKIDNRIK